MLSCSPSSPGPEDRHVEGSEFKENEGSNKLGLVSGLNGKPNPWSFEGLIDINGHSNSRPLIEAEDCNQVSMNCDGTSDGTGTRATFEENSLRSSAQPLEALSGEDSAAPSPSPFAATYCRVTFACPCLCRDVTPRLTLRRLCNVALVDFLSH